MPESSQEEIRNRNKPVNPLSLSLPLCVSAGQPQLLFLAFQDPGPELLVEPQVVFVNQFKC